MSLTSRGSVHWLRSVRPGLESTFPTFFPTGVFSRGFSCPAEHHLVFLFYWLYCYVSREWIKSSGRPRHKYTVTSCLLLLPKGRVYRTERTFCNCEKETVEHLFIKCDITKTFWEKYSEWSLYNASRKPENLTTENIMLRISISELPVEENLCLLHAKYFIYGCKHREQKPSFANFITENTLNQSTMSRCILQKRTIK